MANNIRIRWSETLKPEATEEEMAEEELAEQELADGPEAADDDGQQSTDDSLVSG